MSYGRRIPPICSDQCCICRPVFSPGGNNTSSDPHFLQQHRIRPHWMRALGGRFLQFCGLGCRDHMREGFWEGQYWGGRPWLHEGEGFWEGQCWGLASSTPPRTRRRSFAPKTSIEKGRDGALKAAEVRMGRWSSFFVACWDMADRGGSSLIKGIEEDEYEN
ncbi:hypothetical protein NL676_018631 [Syzygium grande]|nr:hypothetical protein NL676_018631 [Syzygium grande]